MNLDQLKPWAEANALYLIVGAALLFILYQRGYLDQFLARAKAAASKRPGFSAITPSVAPLQASPVVELVRAQNAIMESKLAELIQVDQKTVFARHNFLQAEIARLSASQQTGPLPAPVVIGNS